MLSWYYWTFYTENILPFWNYWKPGFKNGRKTPLAAKVSIESSTMVIGLIPNKKTWFWAVLRYTFRREWKRACLTFLQFAGLNILPSLSPLVVVLNILLELRRGTKKSLVCFTWQHTRKKGNWQIHFGEYTDRHLARSLRLAAVSPLPCSKKSSAAPAISRSSYS